MKAPLKIVVLLSLTLLGGCVPFWRQWLRGDEAKPLSFFAQPEPERWCYNTLGGIDCYEGPQPLPPESLVNVMPPSRFPPTREAYAAALAEYQSSSSNK
ncbi:MAG: hypothetical protein AB7E52_06485 [Bdellovibrionales bacterium]